MGRVDHTPDHPRHALLSGGGSGGHVFPGLAVADELVRRGWQVSWAGSSRGLEARLVAARAIPFFALAARPVVGQGIVDKLRAVATLASSALAARSLVRRLGARVVVGTGGYVSAPAVVGARLAARPVLLLEPNAEAGVANRLLSRLAAEATVAYEEAAAALRCPSRTTGIPVRSEFFKIPAKLLPAPPVRLMVLGGSQGARQLNELMPAALGLLAAESGSPALTVLHQAGERNQDSTLRAYRAAGFPRRETGKDADPARRGEEEEVKGITVEVVPFLTDVAAAMSECHLLVSRAGAITLAEICAAGRASLLAPLSLAAAHQATNARRLEAAGAAEVLPPDADEKLLAGILKRLTGDRERLETMSRAARRLSRAGAAAAIADRVEYLGSTGTRGPRPTGTRHTPTARHAGEGR